MGTPLRRGHLEVGIIVQALYPLAWNQNITVRPLFRVRHGHSSKINEILVFKNNLSEAEMAKIHHYLAKNGT